MKVQSSSLRHQLSPRLWPTRGYGRQAKFKVQSWHTAAERGITIVELLISIGIASLLIGALALFFTRGITTNRENFQQVLTTEDARIQVGRISSLLQNARGVEDDPAWAGAADRAWLQSAEDDSVTFYSNYDTDAQSELVGYYLADGALHFTYQNPGEIAEDQIVLQKGLVNQAEDEPVFTYLDAYGRTIDPAAVTAQNVYQIGVHLLVDAGVHPTPTRVDVLTVLSPRGRLAGQIVGDALKAAIIHLPSGDPPASADARVTLDAGGAGQTDESVTLQQINDGRLTTFNNDYYTNINWQDVEFEGDPPGWYAWVGPIFLGSISGQSYYETDKMPTSDVCTGNDLDILLQSGGCAERTVTNGTLTKKYKPILTYESGGVVYYVRDILFDGP